MAVNYDPRVLAAKQIAMEFGQTHVVVVMTNDETGDVLYASYGMTASKCREARALGDVLFETAMDFWQENL